MMRAWIIALSVVALLCGCEPTIPTQFLVLVDSDIFTTTSAAGAIDLSLADAARPDVLLATRRFQIAVPQGMSMAPDGGVVTRVPLSFAITPDPVAPPPRLLVIARAGVQGGNLERAVETRAIVSFRAHTKLLLPMFLDRACATVRDATGGVGRPLCQSGYTCVAIDGQPRCVPVVLDAPPVLDARALSIQALVALGRDYLRRLALRGEDAGIDTQEPQADAGADGLAPDVEATVDAPDARTTPEGGVTGATARVIEPGPGAELDTRRPAFRFEVTGPGAATGWQVVLCRDRTCATRSTLPVTFEAGLRGVATPTLPLDPGLWWWHAENATLRTSDRAVWLVGDGASDRRAWRAIPDFNGDGYGDLVALRSDGSATTLAVVTDTGSGVVETTDLAAVQPIIQRASPTMLRALGDVNGDGTLDFVAAAPGRAAEVFSAGGLAWSVAPPTTLGARTFAVSIAPAGDVDRDGTADALIGSASTSAGTTDAIHFLRGSRGAAPALVDLDVGERCFGTSADAQLTVVQSGQARTPVAWIGCPARAEVRGFSLPGGGLGSERQPDLTPGGSDLSNWGRSVVAVGDFDVRSMGLGRDALVVAGDTRADIFLFSTSPPARATLCLRVDCTPETTPQRDLRALEAGDLNGDGFHDVVLVSADGALRVYLGRSNVFQDDALAPSLVASTTMSDGTVVAGIGAFQRSDMLADLVVVRAVAGSLSSTLHPGHAALWAGAGPAALALPFAGTGSIVAIAR